MTKIATINGSNTSACEWSPDGRYLMTSILYKKLKVDNGIKVWHYQGVLVYEMAVKELHQAFWKPEVGLLFPSRSELSPPPNGLTVSPPKAVVGAYRPPGARGQASNLMVYMCNIESGFVGFQTSLYNAGIPST